MTVKPGDILLFEKLPGFSLKDFYPWAIRLITGNKVVHTGIVLEVNESFCTYLDINPSGAKVRLLDYQKKVSSTHLLGVSVARTWYNFTPDEVRPVLQQYINGTAYSFRTIFNLVLNHFAGLFKDKHHARVYVKPKANTYTCSSLCAQFLYDLNKTLYLHTFGHQPPCLVEPDDFTRRPFIIQRLDS